MGTKITDKLDMVSTHDKEEIKFFLDELEENLEYLDNAIMALEETPDDQENIDEIFRVAHTIKGSAGFLDLGNLVELGHAMENVFQKFQTGEIPVTKDVIDTVLECKDRIGEIGRLLGKEEDTSAIDTSDLIERVNSFLRGQAPPPEKPKAPQPATPSQPASPLTEEFEAQQGVRVVQIVISENELAPSIRAFLVSKNLEKLGEIVKQEPSEEAMDADEFEMGPDRSVAYWLRTDASNEEIIEEANVDLIDQVNFPETVDTQTAQTEQKAEQIQPPDEKNIKKQAVKEDIETSDTVRMPVSRLDVMLNLVGELVIANSSFLQIQEAIRNIGQLDTIYRDVRDRTKDLVRISSEIQDLVMKSRLVPISQVFNRFKRFVRDYSSKSKKKVRLEMLGESTEIDKKIIDEMIKPLTHLVRNSLDHGLESPEERVAAGKHDTGLLRLTATQEGNYIYVIIEDNGRGLDLDRIVEKAIERELITREEAQNFTDDEIKALIFHSGFSTKESVDEMSGRGVGMDVVKRSVENLNGTIIIDTKPGSGTIVTIKLPLTLAILNALIVRVGNDRFCIPMSSIVETQKVSVKNFLTVENNEMVRLRDSLIPIIKLEKIFPESLYDEDEDENDDEDDNEHKKEEIISPDKALKENAIEHSDESNIIDEYPVIVVDFHDTHVAILVDQFLSRQEMVIKSLSEHYRSIEGISGASILGDGSIILIIDVHGVIQLYRQQRGVRIFQESSDSSLPIMTKSVESRGIKPPEQTTIPSPPSIPANVVPVSPQAEAVISDITSITPEQFEQLEELEIAQTDTPEEKTEESPASAEELIGAHEIEPAIVENIDEAEPETEESEPQEEPEQQLEENLLDDDGIEIFDTPEDQLPEEPDETTEELEEKRIEEEPPLDIEIEEEGPDSIIVDETKKTQEAVKAASVSVFSIDIGEIESQMHSMDSNGEIPAGKPTQPSREEAIQEEAMATPKQEQEEELEDIVIEESAPPEMEEEPPEEPKEEATEAAPPEEEEEESEFDKMRRMMEEGEIEEDDQPLPIDSIALSHFNKDDYNFDKLNNILNGSDAQLLESWLRDGTTTAIEGIKSLTGHVDILPGKTTAKKYSPEKIQSHFNKMAETDPGFVALLLPILPVDGMMYMLLTEKNAKTMASMLYEAAEMDTPEVIDLDPLMEVTNILGSAYTNTLTQLADLPIEPGIPDIVETTEQVMESIEKSINTIKHSILFIENQFLWQDKVVLAELFIMIPEVKH